MISQRLTLILFYNVQKNMQKTTMMVTLIKTLASYQKKMQVKCTLGQFSRATDG